MSVKALENEFNKVFEQYHEMIADLHDIEKEAAEGLVSPEFVDNLEKQIAPIKQNYEWWSYVMYILHEPQRKNKREKYRKTMASKLKNIEYRTSPEGVLESNKQLLDNLKMR